MSGLNLRHGLDLTKGIPEPETTQESSKKSVQTAPTTTKTKKSTSKK